MPTNRKAAITLSSFIGIICTSVVGWGLWSLDSKIDTRASVLLHNYTEKNAETLKTLVPIKDFESWTSVHAGKAESQREALEHVAKVLDRLTIEVNMLNRKVDVISDRLHINDARP